MKPKLRILCVDDEINIQNVIRRQFEDDDVDIITADSGDEGLKILTAEGSVDIILTDYRMPGMNGVEFLYHASKICKDFAGIIISGYTDAPSMEEHIRSGLVFRYLHKPWTEAELKTIVNEAEITLKKRELKDV